MFAEWSAECGVEDPVLVVPWSGLAADPQAADQTIQFIDLRTNPYDLDLIAEAELHPPLSQALRALNASRSPVYTAKCDAWAMDQDEVAAVAMMLDVDGEAFPGATSTAQTFPHGFASYVDLVWRERAMFVSMHQQSQRLDRLVRLLEPLAHTEAVTECVMRPALVDLTGPQEGFAVTLYVKALGADQRSAYQAWSLALLAVVTVVRSREFIAS